jgi:pantetheine-phosphate adenylyltransferase
LKLAVCPGSFDPVTVGHMDIIKRASNMFDEVIAAVMVNPDKNSTLAYADRIKLLELAVAEQNLKNVKVDGFNGLLADYSKKVNAAFIVKGLRAMSDFEYEFQMALTNKKLNDRLETVFLTTSSEYMYLSSSLVRQVAKFNGDVSKFVPECISKILEEKLYKGGQQ